MEHICDMGQNVITEFWVGSVVRWRTSSCRQRLQYPGYKNTIRAAERRYCTDVNIRFWEIWRRKLHKGLLFLFVAKETFACMHCVGFPLSESHCVLQATTHLQHNHTNDHLGFIQYQCNAVGFSCQYGDNYSFSWISFPFLPNRKEVVKMLMFSPIHDVLYVSMFFF